MNICRLNEGSIPRWIDGLIAELTVSYSPNTIFKKYVSDGILQSISGERYYGEGLIFDIMKKGVKSDIVLKNYPDFFFVQNIGTYDKCFVQITRHKSDIPLFTGNVDKDSLPDYLANTIDDVQFQKEMPNNKNSANLKFRVSDIKMIIPKKEKKFTNPIKQEGFEKAIYGMNYVLANKTEIDVHSYYSTEEGFITLSSVVYEGYYGDSDGFGMEPDTIMIAYMNPRNGYMTPFVAEDSNENELYKYMVINNLSMDDIDKSRLTAIKTLNYYHLGYYPAEREGYWGIVDSSLNTLIPFEYTGIYIFSNATFKASKGEGKTGVFDMQNRMIIPLKYKFSDIGYMDNKYDGFRLGHYQIRGEFVL